LVLPAGVSDLLKPHRDYLLGRGFSPKQIEDLQRLWGLAGIGVAGRLSWRLFIPIYYRGEMVSWTTRSLRDTGLRYIRARPEEEKYRAHTLLYGHDLVRDTIIVVEGPFDV